MAVIYIPYYPICVHASIPTPNCTAQGPEDDRAADLIPTRTWPLAEVFGDSTIQRFIRIYWKNRKFKFFGKSWPIHSRAHKTSIKNISATLKFYKMGHEAPEWPHSDSGSFKLGAFDPKIHNFQKLTFKKENVFLSIVLKSQWKLSPWWRWTCFDFFWSLEYFVGSVVRTMVHRQ
jgi:hypothetical protein